MPKNEIQFMKFIYPLCYKFLKVLPKYGTNINADDGKPREMVLQEGSTLSDGLDDHEDHRDLTEATVDRSRSARQHGTTADTYRPVQTSRHDRIIFREADDEAVSGHARAVLRQTESIAEDFRQRPNDSVVLR